MRYSAYLPLSLITASIVLIAPQQAKAISSSEVAQIAKAITVKIDRANSKEYGSGFIVKKDGDTYYVLTAYHVVSEAGKYTLTAPDGEQYNLDYKKLKYKSGTDLAVLQFSSSKTYKVAKIGDSDKATEGTISYVAGFWPPSGSFPAPSFRFMEGKITANATRPIDEGYQIIYSNNTTGGVSGGAVLNENGEVIAIHGRGEAQLDPNSKGELKTISTGNNIGIAVNTFLRLGLMDVGVKAPPIQVAVAPKADDFFLQGNEKYRKKDYQGALADYNRAIALNPEYVDAYINRGVVRKELKQYPQALADYGKAIALNPEYALAYNNRGVVRKELKQYPQALADFGKAIALDPEYALAYNNRGAVRGKLKQYSQALADYDKAIALNPELAIAYINRGLVRDKLKQYPQALADFGKAIALNPELADAYIGRGLVRAELKQYPQALADFGKAIALNPEYVEAYNNRGVVRAELKQYPQALADFGKAIALNPEYALAYTSRGFVRYEQKDTDEAVKDLRKAIELDPQTPIQQLALAVALYAQGKKAEAIELGAKVITPLKSILTVDFLKQSGGWGDRLLADTAKFFEDPEIQPLFR